MATSEALEKYVSAQRRLCKLIWAATAWSAALLTGVGFYVTGAARGAAAPDGGAGSALAQTAVGLGGALALAGLIAFLRLKLLSPAKLGERSRARSVNPRILALSSEDQPVAKALAFWVTINIVTWVLCDAILLAGLSVVIGTRNFPSLLPFLALALGVMLFTFPGQRSVRKIRSQIG